MMALDIVDGHVDLIYHLERRAPGREFCALASGPVTPATLAAGGVRLLVCALYCEDPHNGPDSARGRLQALMSQAEKRLGGLTRLRGRGDLDGLEQRPQPAALFLLENGDALVDGDWDALERWGLRVVGLTHAGANRLADGNEVAQPQGLTPVGRQMLGELERRGWVVDLAHLSAPGFVQVLEAYSGPLISSHTGLRRFCDRRRNLSDDQAAAIIGRDGVIGLSPAPEMLTGGASARRDDLVRQIDWLVQRFGPAGVALGSDYGGFAGDCVGLEDYGKWPLLARDLRALGYPEESVRGILGENWLRFYRRALPAA